MNARGSITAVDSGRAEPARDVTPPASHGRAGGPRAEMQIFLRAHNERNLAEYEGRVDMDAKLLANLIRCTKNLERAVGKPTPPGAA